MLRVDEEKFNCPDGQGVFMKKHAESHMDHGFTQAQWTFIFAKYADKTAFFIDTFELPEDLGTVTNELYGPSAGDLPVAETDVFYAKRGDRACVSRLVAKPKRPTRFVRVIAGPHEEPCTLCGGSGKDEKANYELWADVPCEMCNGDKVVKHACILYTAYGVSSRDVAASPREPADIRKQLEEVERKRYGLHDMSDEHKALTAQIHGLREKRAEADAFWAEHALAAPLSMLPCTDCGAPHMGDAVYDPPAPDADGRCQTCGTL